MSPVDQARNLAAEIARASRRPRAARTMLLDLDGTLAPIVRRPDDARIPGPVLAHLRRLIDSGWRIAIVSGRPSTQVRRIAPVRGLIVFGSHGFEASPPFRPVSRPTSTLRRRLEHLARGGRALASRVPGAWVERKPAGIAFHDRNVDARRLGDWRSTLRRWLAERDLTGLEILPGRRVIELRPDGVHKGAVVRQLLPEPDRRRDASLVAIGDDRTDEDMFRELAGRGLTVRVGRPGVATAARKRLASPRSVARMLDELVRRTD